MTEASTKTEGSAENRIEQIISRGRRSRPAALKTFFLSVVTAVLLWLSFTPVDIGPLAWIALVPILLLTRIEKRTRWMYLILLLVGFLYWLITLQWMRLGDPSMYIAQTALSFYLAIYWPLFILLCRRAVSQFRTPLFVAAPIFWVGIEYLRAYMFTGFSWYYLGHTQHNWIEIIQISDITGAYGVSFLIVMANGALTQAIPQQWLNRLNLEWPDEQPQTDADQAPLQVRGVVVSVTAVLICLGYGYMRRHQGEFEIGPRVGLIQGNFTASLQPDHHDWGKIFEMHHALTGQTIPYQPDLIVWPEAMFRYPLMEHDSSLDDVTLDTLHPIINAADWKQRRSQEKLAEIADKSDAALIVGVNVYEARKDDYYLFNSAAFVEPGKGMLDRYDKIHRVPFGEYIPLQEQFPFIQSLTPFRGDFGIDAGQTIHVFDHEDWRMVPLICFEDTVPHLVRKMVRSASQSEPVDLLVNLTNDGWFHGSSELDQHLITSTFRAIETRTPLVRAVNTGISAIIDGDGVIRPPEHFIDFDAILEKAEPRTSMRDPKTGKFHRQLNCALVGDVPLDPRSSFYVRLGDWFGAFCLIASIAVFIQIVASRLSKLKNK